MWRWPAACASHPHWRGRLARAGLWLQILFDLAVLTVVVHYVGSMETYAPMMYLFHIVLACIFFPPGAEFAGDAVGDGDVPGVRCAGEHGGRGAAIALGRGAVARVARGAADIAGVARRLGAVHFRHGLVSRLPPGRRAARREQELAAVNRRLAAATEGPPATCSARRIN